MVRLKDIARHAGVSVMTVSKALRDAPDVSAATKARIKALAQQMGYVPDSFAQGCATGPPSCSASSSRPSPIPFSRALFLPSKTAPTNWATTFCSPTPTTCRTAKRFGLRRLLSRRVDGLFISPVYRFEAEARIYQEVLARQVPTVLLGPPAPFCKSFVSIEIDELVASYNVTQTSAQARPQTHCLSHRPARCAVGARPL